MISSMISMKILFHVWNLILFKGQKYHQGSLAYFIFVSVQNSFVQCPIVFCDLWPVTCTLAPPVDTSEAEKMEQSLYVMFTDPYATPKATKYQRCNFIIQIHQFTLKIDKIIINLLF